MKLEVIHSYVRGPFEMKSQGGNMYFVSLIDYYIRKIWIYFLKKKSEVFETFKKFKSFAEKQASSVIKMLRTGGGGEYISLEFTRFYNNEGITHVVMAPYTPQHNGIVERRNMTLVNMEGAC